jgi:hypothetical protein
LPLCLVPNRIMKSFQRTVSFALMSVFACQPSLNQFSRAPQAPQSVQCHDINRAWTPEPCREDKRRTREYCYLPRHPSCCAIWCCDRLRCRELLKGLPLPCHRRPPMFRAGRQVTHCSISLVKRFRLHHCPALPFPAQRLWCLHPGSLMMMSALSSMFVHFPRHGILKVFRLSRLAPTVSPLSRPLMPHRI